MLAHLSLSGCLGVFKPAWPPAKVPACVCAWCRGSALAALGSRSRSPVPQTTRPLQPVPRPPVLGHATAKPHSHSMPAVPRRRSLCPSESLAERLSAPDTESHAHSLSHTGLSINERDSEDSLHTTTDQQLPQKEPQRRKRPAALPTSDCSAAQRLPSLCLSSADTGGATRGRASSAVGSGSARAELCLSARDFRERGLLVRGLLIGEDG